jgi:hypothetical protein
MKRQTDGSQTCANARFLALNVQEALREYREKNDEKSA